MLYAVFSHSCNVGLTVPWLDSYGSGENSGEGCISGCISHKIPSPAAAGMLQGVFTYKILMFNTSYKTQIPTVLCSVAAYLCPVGYAKKFTERTAHPLTKIAGCAILSVRKLLNVVLYG